MSNKIQDALKAREEEKKKKEQKAKNNKVTEALKARENAMKSDLSSKSSDWQKRLNAEIEAYNKHMSSSAWGTTFYEPARQNDINLGKLRDEISGYRKYLGEDKADELLSMLEQMKNSYSLRYSFDSEDAYNSYIEERKAIDAILNSEDFEQYYQQGLNAENPSWQDANGTRNILSPFLDKLNISSGFIDSIRGKEAAPVANMVTFAEKHYNDAMTDSAQGGMGTPDSPLTRNVVNIHQWMNNDEKKIYNYYVGKGDIQKANEYLNELYDKFEQRAAGKMVTQWDETPVELLFSFTAGMGQFVEGIGNLDNLIKGTEGDQTVNRLDYANAQMGSNNDGVWKVANDLANTTGNMLPSILVGSLTGGLGGALTMGTSVLGNAYSEMRNLGYSANQARAYAGMTAVAETTLQYALGGISKLGGKVSNHFIGNAISKVDNAIARVAIKWGGNMVSEGIEEGLQSVLEPIFKSIVTGEKVDVDWSEVGYSALLGFLSAGLLEGAPTIAGEVGTYKQGAEIKNQGTDSVNRLKTLGSTYSADSVAYRLAGKVNDKTGAYTIGRLLNEVGAGLSEQNMSDITSALEAKGVTGKDAKTIAKWLNKAVDGGYFSKSQIKALEDNEIISQVMKEVIIDQNSTVNQRIQGYNEALYSLAEKTTSKSKEVDTSTKESPLNILSNDEVARRIAEATGEDFSEVAKTIARGAEARAVSKTTPTEANALTGENSAPTSGKTTVNGKEASIKGIASIKDGAVMLETEGGEKVSLNDVEFGSSEEGLLYESVVDMGLDAATATAFVKGYDPNEGLSAENYILGFKEAYRYGEYGFPVQEMSKNGFSASLSEASKSLAYGLGKTNAKYKTEAMQKAVSKASPDNKVKLKKTVDEGTKTIDEALVDKGLTSRQRDSLKGLKEVSKALGVEFRIFESTVGEDGKRIGENGRYDPNTGIMYIDLYAGLKGEGTLLFTAAHELTHFIRQWSPEKFKVFADFLLDEYGKKGISVNALVQAQIKKAANKGRDIDFDTAYEEVVADACESFLADGNAMTKIAELKVKDKSLWQKIKSYLTKLVEKIKKAYEGLSPDSVEGRIVSEMLDSAEKLRDMWTEALVDASGAYSSSGDVVNVVKEGQFYVIKGDSAVRMSEELELTLAHRNIDGKKTPFVGFPLRYLDTYKKKAAKKGITLQEAEGVVEGHETEENYNSSEFVEIDADTESVSPNMFSERTWTESDYVVHRDQMAEKISKAIGVSVEKAKSYIDDINSIAKMIADDRARLDYEASSFGSAFVSNVEYGGSFDYTTLCKKRRIYTGTFTEIQKRLNDVALTPDDILTIRNLMIEEGIEATCGLCYVEGSRANMGKFAKEFIRLYKRDNPNAWIPNMADVNTPDGVEKMRITHPDAYEQYVYFWNHYGKLNDSDPALFASQQKPKLYEARKEYKGEILEHFKGDLSVAKKNLNGGIRMQSFSDFEIVHLIDTMQVIMDMSTVGLAGQAYTKVPEFAKAFGNTGLKINLSLIAKGIDADGKLIFDDREGMPHETAFELRDKYSKDVGTIIVTFTDAQLLAAMADPRIDYIIPFHRSQWKKGQYGAMGLPKGTKDYTFMQNEKLIKQTYHEYQGRMVKDKASNYMPNEYWDFSKSGKENAEAYLKMCAENNKRPKFYKLLDYDGNGTYSLKKDGSTDGYWKLLIDFKMYDNDGVGSPQMEVTPTFNMDEANTMLNEYKGGHSKYPVANSVVDKFVDNYNKENGTKYSDRDSSGNKLSDAQIEFFKDSKVRDAEGNLLVLYHGTTKGGFTVFDPTYSDDNTSLFFTSSKKVAQSYGISGKVFNEKDVEIRPLIKTVDEAKAFFDSISWKVIELQDGKGWDGKTQVSHWNKNTKFLLRNHQGFPKGSFLTEQSLIDFAEKNAQETDSHKINAGMYEVYLNLTHPLIVDAKGHKWNQIDFVPPELERNVASQEENLRRMGEKRKRLKVYAQEHGITLSEAMDRDSEYAKLYDEGVELEEEYEAFVRENGLDGDINTRAISKYAKRHGYDGVIFKNIYDAGQYDIFGDTGMAEYIAVAFTSEQVKATTNKNPTSNPDIRYSDRDNAPSEFNPDGKTLGEQLEEAYRASESFDQRYVYVGRFSDAFRDLLQDNDIIIHDYPIAMNYRDAYLSMHNKETGKYHGDNINYHDLGVEGLELALDSIKSPISIMKSKKEGKIELVLQGVDNKGQSLLSIVAVNTVTQNGKKFLDAHIVTSVYGRRNIDKYISKAEVEGRLIKPKKEETPQGIPQVQYKGNINEISSAHSIPQDEDSVKGVEEKNSLRDIEPIETKDYVEMYHHFGSTKNYDVAGYILGNGIMLDFSGKHWGDDFSTSRQVDHRDIQEVLGNRGSNNGVNAMIDMIGNGNIRLMPEVGGINLAVKPNTTQMSQLRGYINHFRGEVEIDIDEVGGDTIHTFRYTRGTSSSKILDDIKAYFDEGIVPKQKDESETDIRRFLYSDRDTTSYAPTFYSYMGKVIDDIKLEKMGTSSILNHLKNRGVKDDEIKWSGIEAFLEGKKSVTKAELQEFVAGSQLEIVEQISDDEEYTRWGDYKLNGGENYRELVFQMPNSTYSNNAMRAHWGDEGEGILAHARIQDMSTADGKKMLFIEEIQSDWHNEGAKYGYVEDSELARIDALKAIADELFLKVEDYSMEKTGLAGEWDTIGKTAEGARLIREYREAQAEYKKADDELIRKIPDVPFRDTYHEYVLKRLLRMAAEEGYDSIGWTPADIQSERWSEDYAEGYRIEYDQDIPKFLRKYGKKWGATVGKTAIPSYKPSETYYDANKQQEYTDINEWQNDVEREIKAQGASLDTLWYEAKDTYWVAYDEVSGVEYARAEILNQSGSVWSMDITEPMKESVLHEGQVLYSDRDTDSVSNRTLLANALEGVAKNDIEKNKLEQYKSKIALIEAEQKKLTETKAKIKELSFAKGTRDTAQIKSLQDSATRIANRINTYDRQLLNLEASEPLKNVLKREKQMAYKKAEQRGKEAVAKQKEKDAETIRTLMNRYQESRKKGVEGRNKTELRHKIKNVVSDLDKLLRNPTKEKHIPIGLQLSVAEALDAINMDTMNAGERVAYYNNLIAKSSDPDEIAMLTKKRDFFEYRDANFKERITALKNAYAEIKNSDDPLIKNAHDDAIEELIKNTADDVGNTSLKDMSLAQLEAVYNMYKAILATVRNSNKMFKEGRQKTVTDNSEAVKNEVKAVGGHQDRVLKLTKFFKKFGWNMLKPVTAMKVIGSKTFETLFANVRAAEDTWAVDVNEAKRFYDKTSEKYGYKKWDFKKRFTFKDRTGAEFSLSLEQMMSLYAYSKRAQADKHLELGGFIFDDSIEITEKKFGVPLKYEVNDANPYRLGKLEVIAIANALTNEQKSFVDEMQAYLSDVMGEKGNEVSLAMYDIKLYNEKNYFPLKTSKYFREFDPEKSGTPKIKNSGFSKKTVPQAGNPIVLANFMDVWASHVNDMSMYHAFVLPLEDFMRVYNYSSTAGGYDSVQQYIHNAYGSQANQYIEKLMDDLNGGARVDPSADIINKGLSLFKRASVFASFSVVVQQPSAIARAMAYINPKYFVTATPSAINLKKHKALWEEVKKYAPVAVIKEMGYFDTGVGRSTVEWLKGNQTIKDKMDDVLSKAPAIADELCWVHIWEAVKRETTAKSKSQVGSEEFLKECGERFTEVITNTQVYDSVLSRNAMMRSKDTGMKMATAFAAEPITSVNMMVDGIIQGKRGNKKFTASTVGAISASIILNSILVSLVYAARDDDEDETYLEKYIGSVTSELLDGFNPLTYVPFVKDFWSIAQGYDVERSDMSVISKLWESVEGLFDEDKSGWEKVADTAGAISSLFGIPLKNILRDAKGMYNLTKTITSGTNTTSGGIRDSVEDSLKSSIPLWDRLVGSDSKSDNLYDAIVSGDSAYVERLKAGYDDEKDYTSAVRKAIGDKYKEGTLSHSEAIDMLVEHGDLDDDEAYWKLKEWDYFVANGTTDDYSKYTEFYEAVKTGRNLKAVIKEHLDHGAEAKDLASQITKHYKPLYKEMSNSERASLKGYLLNAYSLLGYNRTEKSKDIDNWLKD